MQASHVGMGVVIAEDVLEIDNALLLEYLHWLINNKEQTFTYSEDGKSATNQTGFKFEASDTGLAPGRLLDLDGSRSNREPEQKFINFRDSLEDAAYRCLVEYCQFFPDAHTTCWWRPSGHIAYYGPNQRIGPHCDDQIPFEWGEAPTNQVSIHNSVSINIYLNTCEVDFSGGEIHFPQVPYTHKPIAGTAAIYPSNFIGRHEVLPVETGMRVAFLTMACYGVEHGQTVGTPMGHRYWMPDLKKDFLSRQEQLSR